MELENQVSDIQEFLEINKISGGITKNEIKSQKRYSYVSVILDKEFSFECIATLIQERI